FGAHPRGHHARRARGARGRPRHSRGRKARLARPALHRGRGLRVRHGGGVHRAPRDRLPQDRPGHGGPPHAQAPERLPRRRAGGGSAPQRMGHGGPRGSGAAVPCALRPRTAPMSPAAAPVRRAAARTGEEYLERILSARVYDVAVETPLEAAPLLSRRTGNTVLLKREDLQPVFSFKLRGAYNKMCRLPRAALKRGVITASAGNHAQGVALAAAKLGCSATVVMPITTPRIKVDAVAARGARVILTGDSYDEAYAEARRLARKERKTFVHPYDDPDVIAGQGTVGMEILRQRPAGIDAVFVAVGGGGLIAGVAAWVKRLSPRTRVIGVEPVDADAMSRSLQAGRRVRLEKVGLFADGVAVRQVGRETFRLCRDLVDEIVLEDTGSILEPAGALSVAGLKAWTERHRVKGRTLVAIACGANMNFDRLRHVAERAELGERREAILAVTIPERPGSFREFCAVVGPRNITEFNY